jgi:hypothetical protein
LLNLYGASTKVIEEIRKEETAEAERERSRPITSANDWGHLRYRFEVLNGRGLIARWIQDGRGTTFNISGATSEDRLEVLCRNAGMLLLHSGRTYESLLPIVKAETDHLRRWLLWIKERDSIPESILGESRESGDIQNWTGGKINDLIRSSVRICTECMTLAPT